MASLTLASGQSVQTEGGFLPATGQLDGIHFRSVSKQAQLWDSWEGSDQRTGRFTYGPFPLDSSLELFVAGYPGTRGIELYLENTSTHARHPLRSRYYPAEAWTRVRWPIPPDWIGTQVNLVAVDNSTGPGGWLGVSLPLQPSWEWGKALALMGRHVFAFVMALLPGLALLCVLRRGQGRSGSLMDSLVAEPLRQLASLLLGSALCAYLAFFITLAHPTAGRVFSWLLLVASLAVLVWRWRVLRVLFAARDFVAPLLLALLASVFFALACFAHGAQDSPFTVLGSRVLFEMPVDPLLPFWFSEILARGGSVRPFFSDWLTSDRPPLQTGFNLMLWPFVTRNTGYVALAMGLQSWVWIGFWFLLRRLGVRATAIGFVFVGALCTGFFFHNTLFVWPKLLPTAFLALAAGLLWGRPRGEALPPGDALLASLSAAFALLCHGGSFFAIGGIGLFFLLSLRTLGWRSALLGAAVVLVLMTPWTLYQKFYDPPGDRLLKWHLGGQPGIDPRPLSTVLRDSYAKLTWAQIIDNKAANFRNVVYHPNYFREALPSISRQWSAGDRAGAFARFGDEVRVAAFFHYGLTLGPLVFGLLGFVWLCVFGPERPETRAAGVLAALGLASVVVWCLLMFEGGSTAIHQGSLFVGLCLFGVAGLGLQAYPRIVALAILLLNALWFSAFWLLAASENRRDWPGVLLETSFPAYWVMLALVALVIGLCLWWAGRPQPKRHRR